MIKMAIESNYRNGPRNEDGSRTKGKYVSEYCAELWLGRARLTSITGQSSFMDALFKLAEQLEVQL